MATRWLFAVAVLSIPLIGSVAMAAVETTVFTDADTRVDSSYGARQDWNFGANTQLYVRVTGDRYKLYVHFNLSALDNTKLVTGARLKMDLQGRNSNYGQTHMVCAIMPEDEDWDPAALPEGTSTGAVTPELDIVWDNAPKCGGNNQANFDDEGTTAAAKVRQLGDVAVGIQKVAGSEMDMDLDVTELIQWALGQNPAYSDYSQVHGGALDDGLTICTRGSSDIYAYYYSREGADGVINLAPRLVITQVPEPATMALLALGSAAMLALRRRRR